MTLRVKPIVFSTATSRVRSRMDIAMVLPETKRIVNTEADAITRMNAYTFPSMARKLSPNAFSVSVRVGSGALANIASTSCDT